MMSRTGQQLTVQTVMPDSLNRLIACTSDDSTIIGICGETKLANERESLTTMIQVRQTLLYSTHCSLSLVLLADSHVNRQMPKVLILTDQVYEYFISHHLTKAFESLFGSVTCLPGCFSVYRIRTADKGRPVIISSVVIDEYAEPNVDTLHKKNLFSLGEDRYLTSLMMKHFPTFKMKFTPDAIAHTVAPSSWSVLLSQRRRWINSTVHNLVELMTLPELCGFCCFSMRFVVFIDLLGTIVSAVHSSVRWEGERGLVVVLCGGKGASREFGYCLVGGVRAWRWSPARPRGDENCIASLMTARKLPIGPIANSYS
jgi:chitin synthase